MAPYTRTVTFASTDLGEDTQLLLTFEPFNKDDLYVKQFPVVWRVTNLNKKGHSELSATYVANIGVSMPQVEGDILVSSSTFTSIGEGQEVSLVKENGGGGPDRYVFTDPSGDVRPGTNFHVYNKTGTIANVGVGFITGKDKEHEEIHNSLLFKNVGDGSNVNTQFHPTLQAYIVHGFQENQTISGEIDSPLLWSQNLSQLANHTKWSVKRDPRSGKFTITAFEA